MKGHSSVNVFDVTSNIHKLPSPQNCGPEVAQLICGGKRFQSVFVRLSAGPLWLLTCSYWGCLKCTVVCIFGGSGQCVLQVPLVPMMFLGVRIK